MFFVVAKVGRFFITPSNVAVLLVLAGLVLAWRWRTAGTGMAAAGAALLVLCGFSPLGTVLLGLLEDRFPPWQEGGRRPTGVIVLGGSSDTAVSAARGSVALNDAAERITETVALARRFPDARVVFTGGDGRLVGDPGNDADDAEAVFAALGLAPGRVTYERESRNTWENAVYTRRLVEPRPGEVWLLVTSGWHMPRAVGAFRRAGLAVEPYPVDLRTRGAGAPLQLFDTASDGLRRTDVAVREWVGLIAYRLSGRSAALFPAP